MKMSKQEYVLIHFIIYFGILKSVNYDCTYPVSLVVASITVDECILLFRILTVLLHIYIITQY